MDKERLMLKNTRSSKCLNLGVNLTDKCQVNSSNSVQQTIVHRLFVLCLNIARQKYGRIPV